MSRTARMKTLGNAVSLGAVAALVAVAPAQALTVGDTAVPSGAKRVVCSSDGLAEVIDTSTDSSHHYTVPAGGGTINSWSFNTTGAKANTPYELLIARAAGSNTYQVVGTDTESVPARAPAVATFNVAHPIAVEAGDIVGIVNHGTQNTVSCLFRGGSLNYSDIAGNGIVNNGSGNPPNGSSFPIERSTPNELVNVSANVVQGDDVGLTQRVEAASTVAGGDAALVLSVSSGGPSQTPVTLTDTVPAGLSVQSVSAGTAPCAVSGQRVSCSLPGAPASVAIVVHAPAAGSYSNTAHAQGTLSDPNPGNNTSTAALKVTSASAPTATPAMAAALSLWTWPSQAATAGGARSLI